MKTPDEIKMSMKCCYDTGSCLEGCSYGKLYFPECVISMCGDTLSYIQQLEAERDAAVAAIPCWISVEERLPEKGNVVLAIWHGEIEIARYTPHRLGWYNFTTRYDSPNAVTHWMPLPKPPKEERNTDDT